jgi:hypothetical protein
MKSVRVMVLATPALLAACVAGPPAASPPPRQEPPLVVPRPQTPPPAPAPADWQDMELSAGAWHYRDQATASEAGFGTSVDQPGFALSCDKARRNVRLARSGITTGNSMTVRTSAGTRNFALSIEPEATGVYASVSANDPFLDNIAFSRGRFTVEVPGMPTLVMPAWPEPARVIEDCRA